MSPGAQNMKIVHDALGTAENESGSAKHENGTRRPWYRRKRVRVGKNMKTGSNAVGTAKMCLVAQNMKTRADAFDTAEN
jgi:hypothetical protein